MHWNYRIVKETVATPLRDYTSYAIKSVYYDDGKESYSDKPLDLIEFSEDNETDEEMRNKLLDLLLLLVKEVASKPIVDKTKRSQDVDK